jgi:hypothetical protein
MEDNLNGCGTAPGNQVEIPKNRLQLNFEGAYKYPIFNDSIAFFLSTNLQFYTMSFYSLQCFKAKNLNLQEFQKIIVDFTINMGTNLRSIFDYPPPSHINNRTWVFLDFG